MLRQGQHGIFIGLPDDHKVLLSHPKYSLNDVPGLKMAQIVELLIVLVATKELSKEMAGCPDKPHITNHRIHTPKGDTKPHGMAPEAHHMHLQGKTCLLGPQSHEHVHHERLSHQMHFPPSH